MSKTMPCLLLSWLLACLAAPPEIEPLESASENEGSSEESWHEIDPPSVNSDAGSGPPHTRGDEDGSSNGAEVGGSSAPDASLRIVGAYFDPPGTDGASDSPEWVELINLGPEPFPLLLLDLEARSWPQLNGSDFEVDSTALELAVGGRFRVFRYSEPPPNGTEVRFEGEHFSAAFVHSSGLRNADGAVLIRDARGNATDLLCWGSEAQPPPYDDAYGWSGACVAAEAGSACRINSAWDQDTADDWQACE